MMMPMNTSISGSTSDSRRCMRVSTCSSRKSETLLSMSSSEPVASPTLTMSIDMSVKTPLSSSAAWKGLPSRTIWIVGSMRLRT